MGVHKMFYDQDTKNPLSGSLKAKGWIQFEVSGSRYKNEYSGYWIESEQHPEINGKWLGQTYKDALYTVRNDFPVNIK